MIIQYPDPNQGGKIIEARFDMVVLSVGVRPPSGAAVVSQQLDFDLNEYGFCQTDKFNPLETTQPGIYVCGAFSSPKEIAETIIDSAGAAGDVMRLFQDQLGCSQASHEYPFMTDAEFPPERNVAGEEPRIGVFSCRCYPTMEGIIDVENLLDRTAEFPHVVHTEEIGYGCFSEGLDLIKKAVNEHQLNRVVVAGCSHRTHESLFQKTVREAGLNSYLLEMVNLRGFAAWVHPHQVDKAFRKGLELVRVGVGRAAELEPIYKSSIPPHRRALVIGGGVAGMTAALSIADSGYEVVLVEKADSLGGNLQKIHFLVEGENPNTLLRDQVNRIISHSRITVVTNTVVEKHEGHVGAYHAILRHQDGSASEISHGVTIVATGGSETRVNHYLLGEHPAVITQLELEDKLAYHLDEVTDLKQVVMIQCVKPQEETYEYCSRICCISTIKNAIRLKTINPDCQVTVLYKDIITYGFREQYYTEARDRGVVFARYDDQQPPEVDHDNGQIIVTLQERMIDRELILKPDLLVLSTSIQPSTGTKDLAKVLNVPISNEGFFLEAHIKMRPMDFMEEGIFVCGIAHYPKFIEESISQAQAAAGRATTILSKKPFHFGGTIAVVDPDKCVGCLTCTRTCPFEIPKVSADFTGVGQLGGAAFIEPTLCHGCGTCTAECPANAIQILNYTDNQIMVPEFPVLGSWVEL